MLIPLIAFLVPSILALALAICWVAEDLLVSDVMKPKLNRISRCEHANALNVYPDVRLMTCRQCSAREPLPTAWRMRDESLYLR